MARTISERGWAPQRQSVTLRRSGSLVSSLSSLSLVPLASFRGVEEDVRDAHASSSGTLLRPDKRTCPLVGLVGRARGGEGRAGGCVVCKSLRKGSAEGCRLSGPASFSLLRPSFSLRHGFLERSLLRGRGLCLSRSGHARAERTGQRRDSEGKDKECVALFWARERRKKSRRGSCVL